MRRLDFIGAVACAFVAIDSYEKATGAIPQQLLAPNALWLWYWAAIFWIAIAVLFFKRKTP